MSRLTIDVVHCGPAPDHYSQISTIEVESTDIDDLVIETIDQEVAAGETRGLHNAAHHAEHGPVTYLQQVNEGGFSVLVGSPDDLKEHSYAPNSLVAFIDDHGPGHSSKVGPEGVKRTLRILSGHLEV